MNELKELSTELSEVIVNKLISDLQSGGAPRGLTLN